MEQRQDSQETQLRDMAAVVSRVELNQGHQLEVSKLRFDAIDIMMKTQAETEKGLDAKLTAFMLRIDSLMSGETQTAMTRDILADYAKRNSDLAIWQKEVDDDREEGKVFHAQVALLGKLAYILVSTNIVAVVIAIAAAVTAATNP